MTEAELLMPDVTGNCPWCTHLAELHWADWGYTCRDCHGDAPR